MMGLSMCGSWPRKAEVSASGTLHLCAKRKLSEKEERKKNHNDAKNSDASVCVALFTSFYLFEKLKEGHSFETHDSSFSV